MTTSRSRYEHRLTRRTLLQFAASSSLVALAAACGGDEGAQSTSSRDPLDAGDGGDALAGELVEVWRDPG